MSTPEPVFSITSQSEDDTRMAGRKLSAALESLSNAGVVIGLSGTLGAGNTKLTQGIANGFGVPVDNVTSPTFTLCVPHEGSRLVLHLDAYRIASLEEVDELGLDEHVDMGSVIVVEWAERIISALPPLDLEVKLKQSGDSERVIEFQPHSNAGNDIVSALKEVQL